MGQNSRLINSTIHMFIQNIATRSEKKTGDGNTIRIVLQIAANGVRRKLRDPGRKICVTLQPILSKQKFGSRS